MKEKQYICEDAGKALCELQEKLQKELDGTISIERNEYIYGRISGLSTAMKLLQETQENWKAEPWY